MAIGNILVLGAIGIIALFRVFGFLLGLLRGFRKSMFFTIVFIVVLILSFIVATVLSKSLYGGPFLWRFAKKVIPDSMREGAANVNSLKEFVRFYITHNYNEMLDSGITAGESIVANQNAMGVIDGLIIMILKIVMLVASYLVLNVLFYLVFGLIYLLFLRQKPYIEEVTTTDEDGNETVEEREVKPKKKRLLGGIVGGAKGFVKAMVILIPLSFLIGIAAHIEVPKSSSVSNEVRLSQGSSNNTFNQVIEACQKYDNTVGKIYLGLDDKLMDAIISYEVKGADGKKVKVVVRKELTGFIDIYNTIEKEIGVDNLKDYDFKNNINSKEMRNIVASFSDNISKSNAITTTLTAVGNEVTVILADKTSKNDTDAALFFSEFDLTDKNASWCKEQIAQLGDIYNSFADMNLDFSKADTKEYNAIFADTKAEDYENFVDSIFENELLDMAINGGLKYAVKKLPASYGDVTETSNQVIKDDKVNEEFKAFSKLIDFIRDDIKFKDGSVDTDQLKVKTLKGIVNTEVLVRSKIVGKLVESVLKNTLGETEYNGVNIGFNKEVFNDANFNIHNELRALVKILEDGYGEEFAIGGLKSISDVSKVGQICNMLESDGMKESLLGKELFSKTLQTLVTTVDSGSDYSNVTWVDEIAPMSQLLSTFGTDTNMSDITLAFDTIKVATLDVIEAQIGTSVLLQNKMANSLAEPMHTSSMLTETKTSAWDGAKWNFEFPKINKVIKTLANENNEIVVSEINMTEESEIKQGTFRQIEANIADSEALENLLKNTLHDSLYNENNTIDSFPDPESITGVDQHSAWWEKEITGLCNVIYKNYDSEDDNAVIKLKDFSNTEETKVAVVRSLYADSGKVRENGQKSNIGVSEYIQYLFKPELRDVSRRSQDSTDPKYEIFYKYDTDPKWNTFNWDGEIEKIIELFISTQASYDSVNNVLVQKNDNDTIKISEVYFGLYGTDSKQLDSDDLMTGLEAELRNKARITKIKTSIDGGDYLQFTIAPDIKNMMSQTYYKDGCLPENWNNDDWVREITALDNVVDVLITNTNPKMENIQYSSLTDEQKTAIGSKVASSYLLQSKMSDTIYTAIEPIIGHDAADTKIRTAVTADWVDGKNTAFEALWNNPTA